MTEEDEAFEELAKRQGDWGLQGSRKHQIMRYLENDAMREVQRLGQEIEQEPVALHCCGYTDASAVKWNQFNRIVQCHNCGQIYTPPQRTEPVIDQSAAIRIATVLGWEPKRKPLTDDELSDIWFKQSTDWMEFARAIEAAHGIKGEV